MTNKDLIRMVENKQPIQIVQVAENTWEQEAKLAEEAILREAGISEERIEEIKAGIYEAELVERGNYDPNVDIVNHPPFPANKPKAMIDPKTNAPVFYVKIKLITCYFTKNVGFWESWWTNAGKAYEFPLETVEEARDLLEQLQTKACKLVDKHHDRENYRSRNLSKNLENGLRDWIRQHENGEVVTASFKEPFNY